MKRIDKYYGLLTRSIYSTWRIMKLLTLTFFSRSTYGFNGTLFWCLSLCCDQGWNQYFWSMYQHLLFIYTRSIGIHASDLYKNPKGFPKNCRHTWVVIPNHCSVEFMFMNIHRAISSQNLNIQRSKYMSPVSPVFHTVVTWDWSQIFILRLKVILF